MCCTAAPLTQITLLPLPSPCRVGPSCTQIPFHPEIYAASGYPEFVQRQAARGPAYAAAAGRRPHGGAVLAPA